MTKLLLVTCADTDSMRKQDIPNTTTANENTIGNMVYVHREAATPTYKDSTQRAQRSGYHTARITVCV
jgi:hypothetical protein